MSLYRIKKLTFERYDAIAVESWQAPTPLGLVVVFRMWHDSPWVIALNEVSGNQRFNSFDEAKSTAEEWYRSKLLEALEPATEQDTRGTE